MTVDQKRLLKAFRKVFQFDPSCFSFRHSSIIASKISHVLIYSIIIAIVLLTTITGPCYGDESSISWTEDELNFMEKDSVIRLGIDPNFVPFEFIDEDSEYRGIAADYLALINEKTGLQFEIVKGLSWPEAYDMALAGDGG
ncbi:MAG: transporter substrate-binding domain-containing protein [Tepidanaerobacteraceae bacterium]